MSQNDYTIANQTTPLFRADLNSALQALASNSSGATAPATTYANMLWYDTAANTLYMRSEANDVWIRIGVLNQSTSKFEVEDYLGFSPVQQGGGVGQLGNKIFIGWSGSELLAQVDDNSSFGGLAFKADIPAGIGVGQTWQAVSRSANVWYQNTTGRSIGVYAYGSISGGVSWDVGVSTSNYINISMSDGDSGDSADYGWIIVPVDHYYRNTGTWNSPRELR
jgi:hypothetical protein